MFIHKITKSDIGEAEVAGVSDYGDFDNATASIVIGNMLYVATNNSDGDIKAINISEDFPAFNSAGYIRFLNDGTGSGYRVSQIELIQNKLVIVSQNQQTGIYYLHRTEVDFSDPIEIHQSNNFIRMGTA